ncbi:MAG: tRNA (guanosine(46)-N7)-methyltransferase TrmB [Bacteroidota bacterium]
MGQKKLIRFAELKTFDQVLQFPENMAGKWKAHFQNDQPLTLELACGKGEYAIGLARLHPNKNFVGIDIKGNRLWVGAKIARRDGLTNVAFLRTQIDRIAEYFEPGEAEEIWITFPDPQLRWSKIKKRLTHPKFLRLYERFLTPGGKIHLKTDSPDLYRFTKEVIQLYKLELLEDSANLYASPQLSEELQIKTHYESLDIAGSNRIHYLCFRLTPGLQNQDMDSLLKEKCRPDAVTD